jgi:amino acid permease
LVKGKPESLYELGYILIGRKSIFIISLNIALNGFGLVTIYFQVFSKTCASVMVDILKGNKNNDNEFFK